MKVYIEVVAMDHDAGVKKTMIGTFDVPGAVLQLHEMLAGQGNKAEEMVKVIAMAVYSGACKELNAARRNSSVALEESLGGSGGKIGGTGGGADPLSSALGLDLIQRMSAPAQAPRQPAPRQSAPVQQYQDGPGPIGFPSGRR